VVETASKNHTKTEAHVSLDGVPHVVPAGEMKVSDLKAELGVDAATSLFEKVHGKRVLLADDATIEVKSGQHFEAIPGGGVS
jgi:hypothetical protein